MTDGQARCFVCGARGWVAPERPLVFSGRDARSYAAQCDHCGLLVTEAAMRPDGAAAAFRHLRDALSRDRFAADPDAPYGLDLYTLRTAATRWSRHVRAADAAQAEALRQAHSTRPAEALVSPFSTDPCPITVAMLCRAAQVQALARRARQELAWAARVILVADGPPAAPSHRSGRPDVLVLTRPLAGNFASQRNVAQGAAETDFVLHLDTDERLEPGLVAALPGLIALAEEGGVASIGFARQNRVDGILSDLYPDIQYRLNRRELRFAGRVHERPDLGGDWRRSVIALSGAIRHELARAHVEARSSAYEAIAPGEGRLGERGHLLTPYRD